MTAFVYCGTSFFASLIVLFTEDLVSSNERLMFSLTSLFFSTANFSISFFSASVGSVAFSLSVSSFSFCLFSAMYISAQDNIYHLNYQKKNDKFCELQK